jgi:hypothetical protein
MARIRQLKPGFFLDEDLAEVSFAARLLFAGLWCLADRNGRLEDRCGEIRVQVFPFDNLEAKGVSMGVMLDELARPRKNSPGGFILRYEAGGRRYIQIRNFARHQHCHPDEKGSSLPGPPDEPGNFPASKATSTSTEASTSTHTSGGSRRRGGGASGRAADPAVLDTPENRAPIDCYNGIFDTRIGYTPGNLRASERAFSEGYTLAQMDTVFKAVKDRASATASWCAENNREFGFLIRPTYVRSSDRQTIEGTIDRVLNELATGRGGKRAAS